MSKFNKFIHNNRIESVKDFINNNLYDDALTDDDFFSSMSNSIKINDQ